MDTSFTIRGTAELRRALLEAGDLALRTTTIVLEEEMDKIVLAAAQLAPVDTGALKASIITYTPEVVGTKVIVKGGFTAPYAVYVHEKLGVHHPSGQAKFLEQPAHAEMAGLPARLAEKIRAAWQRLAR